jgi:subtilisin-like proprotein convertase family protein
MVPNAQISDSVGIATRVSVKTDGCDGTLNSVRYLEHVQCKISLRFYPRGNVMIVLTSPSGTKSNLLFPRERDTLADSFDEWPFLSVHFWGEAPQGTWTLEVLNMGQQRPLRPGQGLLRKWQLIFYGTDQNPVRIPRNVEFRGGRQQPFESDGNIFSGNTFLKPSTPFNGFFPFATRKRRAAANETLSR